MLLEKLTGLRLVKRFPAFYGTRRFITALTSVRHLSLSWASPIQSTYPHPTSWRSILILSTHLRLGLLSGLFPSGFPTKTLYAPLSSPIRTTCPAHLILLDFITRTILGEEYRSFSHACLYTIYNCNFKLNLTVSSYLLSCSICLTKIMSHDLYRPTNGVTIWRYPRNTQRRSITDGSYFCVLPPTSLHYCVVRIATHYPHLGPRLKKEYSYIFSTLLCLHH